MKYLIFILISSMALAEVSHDVLIRGKIGNDFNEKQVKVHDTLGQSYYLPRSSFPKNFKFKQGESFSIEVHEKVLDKVKIIKK